MKIQAAKVAEPIAHLGLDSPAVTLANTLRHEFGVASPPLPDGSTVADLLAVLAGGQPTQRQVDFASEERSRWAPSPRAHHRTGLRSVSTHTDVASALPA